MSSKYTGIIRNALLMEFCNREESRIGEVDDSFVAFSTNIWTCRYRNALRTESSAGVTETGEYEVTLKKEIASKFHVERKQFSYKYVCEIVLNGKEWFSKPNLLLEAI